MHTGCYLDTTWTYNTCYTILYIDVSDTADLEENGLV